MICGERSAVSETGPRGTGAEVIELVWGTFLTAPLQTAHSQAHGDFPGSPVAKTLHS